MTGGTAGWIFKDNPRRQRTATIRIIDQMVHVVITTTPVTVKTGHCCAGLNNVLNNVSRNSVLIRVQIGTVGVMTHGTTAGMEFENTAVCRTGRIYNFGPYIAIELGSVC
jgi:hypothetical protein